MSHYAILRTAKLKTFGNIGASLSHNYRTRETHNANPERSHLNRHTVAGGPSAVMEKIKARLPEKRRKDAVLCIEYMIGSSPGALTDEQHKKYLSDALKWLKERHGEENVIAGSIHFDERTPHLCAYVVPLDESGKLNAKKFLGGRQTLSAMQTDFAKSVGEKYGLERGIERSTARHTTIKEWYGLLNESVKPVEIPPAALTPKVTKKRALLPDVVETHEEIAKRLNRRLEQLTRPALARAKMSDLQRKKADEIRQAVKATQQELKDAHERARQAEERAQGLRSLYEALTPSEQKSIVQQAKRNVRVRERCERLLSRAYDAATGSVARFARAARDALHDAAGRWWSVSWQSVDAAFKESESAHKTPARDVLDVLIEHSPSHANTSEKQAQQLRNSVSEAEKEVQEARKREESAQAVPAPSWSEPAAERPQQKSRGPRG